MEGIYSWVKNITYYLIFITVINNLLPNRKYEKYIKLFAGLILIIIVIQPITKGLNLEENLAYYFESISFKNEINDFSKELLGIEQQRLHKMFSQYEEAVAIDLKRITEDSGFFVKQIKVTIEQDANQNSYGTVSFISMTVTTKPQELAEVLAIDPVVIEIEHGELNSSSDAYQEEQTILNVLRRKVESYYGLEGSHVEIRLENE